MWPITRWSVPKGRTRSRTHSMLTPASPTRGTWTTSQGAGVRPAFSNSSASGGRVSLGAGSDAYAEHWRVSGSDGEEAKRSEVEGPFAAHRRGPGYRSGHDRAYQQLVEALLFEVRRVYNQGRSSLGSYSRDTIQKACVTCRPRGPRPPVPSPATSAWQGKAGQPFSYFADQPSG